jgi:beta-barrel assembly-enhancing protease
MTRKLPLLVVVAGVCCGSSFAPAVASAQLLDKIGKAATQAKQAADDLTFTDEEEQDLGRQVSAKIRERFGVVQDPAIHRYVSLVGLSLASESKRPGLPWTFIVLDTDAVNAFAAPGGYVHITKGALALMSNEAELAGVLGHELTHITEKHTIAALKKAKGTDLAMKASGKGDSKITAGIVEKMKDAVITGFGQKEELEADAKGLALANKVGYAPNGLPGFLQKLVDRNKGTNEKHGLFASHPAMEERLNKMNAQIPREKLTASATLEARLKKYVSYKPVPLSGIATVQSGSAGLAGSGGSSGGGSKKSSSDGDAKASDGKNTTAKNTASADADDDSSKKKSGGFGLSKLSGFGGGEKKQAQVTGSGAGRGLDPEVDAKGGPNPAVVAVKLTPADVEAFKKEGKLS